MNDDPLTRQRVSFGAVRDTVPSGRRNHGVLRLESGVGGRLVETIETATGTHVVERGRVMAWDPPNRLELEWRAANFTPAESTTVEVVFEPSSTGTLVTVTHRGWSRIRPDHPVRHGQEVVAFMRENGLWWGELVTSYRELAERGNSQPGATR